MAGEKNPEVNEEEEKKDVDETTKNQFYEEKSRKVYFLIPNFPMNRIRLWEEYFLPFAHINLNILYDNYINIFRENFYFNIFG